MHVYLYRDSMSDSDYRVVARSQVCIDKIDEEWARDVLSDSEVTFQDHVDKIGEAGSGKIVRCWPNEKLK